MEAVVHDALAQILNGLSGVDAVELSHALEERMPAFPSHPIYFKMRWQPPGEPAVLHQVIMCDHSGTHVDAPSHFPLRPEDAARSIDAWEPLHLVGRGVCVHVGPLDQPDALVTADDVMAWERDNVRIAAGDIVVLDCGWTRKWVTGNEAAQYAQGWPGVDRSFVDYVVERGVRAVGTDSLSIDTSDGAGGEFPAHTTFLPKGIAIFENLTNLSLLPAEFVFMALPLPLKGASGSPVRAVALVPKAG
jgi:kynurenine formamidase